MPSHKSSAVEPKRARGRARVEAVLAAASRVFAEQGYDRATMTEIAARSDTAIGSLYRFFPTKEALGEALLERYLERSAAALDALAQRAPGLASRELADAIIAAITGPRSDELRAGALAVVDGRGDVEALRRAFRVRRRKQLAQILRTGNPALEAAAAQDRAALILYLLRGENTLPQEGGGQRLIAELRRLVRLYIEEAAIKPRLHSVLSSFVAAAFVASALACSSQDAAAADSGRPASASSARDAQVEAGGAPADRCQASALTWKTANKTSYTSYPAPGSEECIKFSGCKYEGEFAACDDKKSEDWVSKHNIVAIFPDLDSYALHDLCLSKPDGSHSIIVTVYDTCMDSDCDGCCTQNRGSAEALIDVEHYTEQRWGVPDGPIRWADLGPTSGSGCADK